MGSVRHGKRLYKQMSLEVAVRNPERYDDILRTFSKFEGVTLDDAGILEIYSQLYMDGVVDTTALDINTSSSKQIKDYVKTRTHNNEWGFPTGYQAGFTRYLKTLSEFGFIYAQYKESLRLSPIAKALVSNQITLSEAFAIQSLRFWRKSPYRRVLNDFNYFRFILEVLLMLRQQGHRLSYNQFMLSLFSETGDASDFIDTISAHPFASQDDVYQYILEHYKADGLHGIVCKQQTSFNDYGNTVFRVLQLTGFISVEYNGVMLLSINNNRKELLEELLAADYSISEEEQEDEKLYFNKLGSFNPDILALIQKYREVQQRSVAEYNLKIKSIIESYKLSEESIARYLKDVSSGKKDSGVFWFLQAPLKFEFLLSLYLYLCLGDEYDYKPNYICDEVGIPYSHAPGNIGDIEVYNEERYWLIEATLIKGKVQQINNETINLFRHIDRTRSSAKYMCLIAPYIHADTELLIKAATMVSILETKSLIFSKPYNTDDFVDTMTNRKCLDEIRDTTMTFAEDLRDMLQVFTATMC